MDVLYKMDHYDTYTYLIIGPISFLASLLFICINIYFKEARNFPGILLTIISVAELGLCVHWFASGLYTPFILGYTVKEEDYFCKVNSYAAFLLASVEFYFHLAFLISIIIMFRNTMKEIKFKSLFSIIPVCLVFISLYFAIQKNSLGQNIYGTCSINQLTHGGKLYILALSAYLITGVYALWILRQFMKMTKKDITQKDDFYNFYFNYTILIFILYTIVGLGFIVGKNIIDCETNGTPDEKLVCHKWFFFSRIGNNVKVFIPLWAFLLRIKDPFLRKLVQKFWKKDGEKDTTVNSFEEEIVIMNEDFLINNEIKGIRKGMIRTILLGLSEYYGTLIYYYQKIDDEQLINNLRQPIGKNAKSSRNIPNFMEANSTEKIFDCGMSSFGSKQFKKVLDTRELPNLENSFSIIKNREAIDKIGDIDGGSGGEFFLMTFDKRFIIKTITEDEEKIFKNFLSNYCEYLSNNTSSFICRIVGLFSFEFNITSQKIRLIVMENIFKKNSSFLDRKYDLKGSLYNRQTLKKPAEELRAEKEKKIKCTLKDVDFASIDARIELDPVDRMTIVNSLINDSQFFMKNKIIDYSLLLGIIEVSRISREQLEIFQELEKKKLVYFSKDGKLILIMGIIDYFQLYTFAKFFEKWSKKLLNCRFNLETSSQPSAYYSKRFNEYISRILA